MLWISNSTACIHTPACTHTHSYILHATIEVKCIVYHRTKPYAPFGNTVRSPGRPYSLSHTVLQQMVYTPDSTECFPFPLLSTKLHALLGGLTRSHYFTSDSFPVYVYQSECCPCLEMVGMHVWLLLSMCVCLSAALDRKWSCRPV